METFANTRSDLRIRKIELPRRGSEAGDQFQIRSIPHLVLFRGTDRVADGTPAVTAALNSL
ncbi:hypothetical protein [Saltatorellus ferox]|uniref:hypothetical protein n=1 Tax=Saltatorellus ferox TaxID=2528018 RepID=UPI003AF3A4D5